MQSGYTLTGLYLDSRLSGFSKAMCQLNCMCMGAAAAAIDSNKVLNPFRWKGEAS